MSIARRSSGQLYVVLDVTKDASPSDIKKAYHKKALQLHPDKTGGTTTEEFKRVQEAHAILSDPEKRKLYDTFGRAGMAKLEQYDMGGAAATAFENPAVLRLIAFFIFLVFFLGLLFVALVVSKIDNHKSWSYAAVFTPIWIYCFVFLILGGFVMAISIKGRRFQNFFAGASLWILIISLAFFVRVLDGVDAEWNTFFVCAFCNLAVYYLSELLSLRPSLIQEMLVAQGHPAAAEGVTFTSPIYITAVVSTIFNAVCNITFFALMRQRLCLESPTLSFYAIFAPLFVRFSLPVVLSFICSMREAHMALRERICVFIFVLITLAATLYTFVMISVKMQKEWNLGENGPSAAVCAVMLFIVLGVLTLVSMCAFCCAGGMVEQGMDGYTDLNGAESGAGTSAATPADDAATESATKVNVSSPIVAGPPAEVGAPSSNYNSLD